MGCSISLSAASTFITPLPFSVCIRSWMSNDGRPKNLSAPWFSSCSRARWMAPTVAVEMLPYLVVYSLACFDTQSSMERRSLMSSMSTPRSSAMRNTMFSTPSCVSFSCISRDSSCGPICDTVARMGCPCSPNTSKNRTGQAWNSGFSMPNSGRRFSMKPLILPACEMPLRSPFMSAMKQGTPA